MRSRYAMWTVAAAALALSCGNNNGGGGGYSGAGGGATPGGSAGGNTGDGVGRDAGTGDGGTASDGGVNRDGGTGGDGGTARAVKALTDAQVLQVLTSVNNGEVMLANAVMARLTDPDAKAFAQQMITEHTQANELVAALGHQQGLEPQASALSVALDQQASVAAQRIGTTQAPLIETMYIDYQIGLHRSVLDLIDCVIGPQVQNQALKTLLRDDVRPEVANHLIRASAIAARLAHSEGDAGSVPDGGPADGGSDDCSQICASSGGLLPPTLVYAACQ